MAYVKLPRLSGALQTCLQLSPPVISAVSLRSFRNADISYLQPLQPSRISHHPAAFPAVQSGFCSSTHVPSSSQTEHLSTFNGLCSRAKNAAFACTNTAIVAAHQNLHLKYSDLPLFPLLGNCSTWCLACHVLQSVTRKCEHFCQVPHLQDSRPLEQ